MIRVVFLVFIFASVSGFAVSVHLCKGTIIASVLGETTSSSSSGIAWLSPECSRSRVQFPGPEQHFDCEITEKLTRYCHFVPTNSLTFAWLRLPSRNDSPAFSRRSKIMFPLTRELQSCIFFTLAFEKS